MNDLSIVAFLQNMWVLPHQVARVLKGEPTSEARERMIHYSLFAGCLTGRRLKTALGEDLCRRIHWQEASPVVADNPRVYYPPQPVHIREVLNKHKPQIVISFTKTGAGVIRAMLDPEMVFISCAHPACRQANIVDALNEVRRTVEAVYNARRVSS